MAARPTRAPAAAPAAAAIARDNTAAAVAIGCRHFAGGLSAAALLTGDRVIRLGHRP